MNILSNVADAVVELLVRPIHWNGGFRKLGFNVCLAKILRTFEIEKSQNTCTWKKGDIFVALAPRSGSSRDQISNEFTKANLVILDFNSSG